MKFLLVVACGLIPASRLKNRFLSTLGHEVADTAHVAPVILWNVKRILLDERARVGPFNVFRDLSALVIGKESVIGQWNWISAARPLVQSPAQGTFRMGRHSALTSRHYVDASGGVEIGDFSTVAGVRSTFITHGIDWRINEQITKAICIGNYCLISSNVSLPPGAVVPDKSVVGMGATITGGSAQAQLWVSERARPVRQVSGTYFARTSGFVHPKGHLKTVQNDE